MEQEIKRFGDRYAVRPAGSSEDWTVLDEEDMTVAQMAQVMTEEAFVQGRRENPPVMTIRVVRSDRNQKLAEELGLDADELAEFLTSDRDTPTRSRVAEERFDAMAAELGQTPEEFRARFRGTFRPE